jgi:protoheme IX farnesyltransferase
VILGGQSPSPPGAVVAGGYSGPVPFSPRRDLRAAEVAGRGHPVTVVSERPVVTARRLSAVLRAYVALTKPRIIELLLVTTLPAMLLASRGWPSWRLLVATLVGGTLAAGAANVFNCWYDRDIDRVMHRTERRPLPMGEVSARGALVFGVVLTVASIALLAATTTPLAAGLAAGAIFYYAVVYTMVLKRHTRHSTLFGGVPGAAPVLIGWAAVTGSLAWPAVVFFGVVFCWQLPHFWALAMRFRADYVRADVPMLPVVASQLSVGRQTVGWSWLTVLVSLLLWPVAAHQGIGWIYTVAAAGLGGWFAVEAHALLRRIRRDEPARPMKLFHISITYMTLMSVAIILDVLV